MRRRIAVLIILSGIALFVFFVPVVYDPPFQQVSTCPHDVPSCTAHLAAGAYLVSMTYIWTGYGGTYYYNTYQVHL